ncbi:MAG: hypothetical protein COV29_02855 [Candidatus Yanofskybacteria bacterium CG10_big_fil_rev_8_21_14_0_10_36_16]|uniref:PIG-L family deacetylase n=1 Tax=Candidatus Yanofskybacteria bacterium CG10_big_fil_rev_8_21_14_0_10_36_16 TaxID=1975096 RepID=A0A2J0QAR2_9BACT|nr:MAG: hypothetical protein COV29_02855 [Candidatus Yanofskybacteria bacterium CG10_big_fil_rev_8_21_14_0_10_36_16]
MFKELKLDKGNALVIVAHPDDELIWMGGTILKYPEINWTIFTLCRSDDPDRAPKYEKVCRYYGAKGMISDLEDEGIMNIRQSVPEIEKRIIKYVPNKTYQWLFTHNVNGEYGHIRHKGVHKAVKNLITSGKLTADNLFLFSYNMGKNGKYAVTDKERADFVVNLNKQLHNKKLHVIQNIYGFLPPTFEVKSCHPVETFCKFKK